MSYKFEHAAITVNSIEETARWYEANLGFKREEISDKPALELRACKLRLDDFCLEVLEPHSRKIPEKREGKYLNELLSRQGINHIAFCVPDINESYRTMKINSVRLVSEIKDSKYFFCEDNNGILLEIRQSKSPKQTTPFKAW